MPVFLKYKRTDLSFVSINYNTIELQRLEPWKYIRDRESLS